MHRLLLACEENGIKRMVFDGPKPIKTKDKKFFISGNPMRSTVKIFNAISNMI